MAMQSIDLRSCRFVEEDDGEVIRIFDEEFRVKLTGADTGNVYAVIVGSVAPGGGPPLHAHPTNETFYVLTGEIEFTQRTEAGLSRFRGGPGAIAHAPAAVPHRFENVSPGRSAMATIIAPEMVEFLRELGRVFPPGSKPDMEKMLEIHERYRIDTFHGTEGSRPEPEQDGATSTKARGLAWQFRHEADQLVATLEACPEDRWRAVCVDTGWTIGVQAHHIAVSMPLIAGVIRDAANGRPHGPTPTSTLDAINARHAEQFAAITKGEVVALLQDYTPLAVETYRTLTDEQLAQPGWQLDGPAPTVSDLIERLAIGEITRHGAAICEALGSQS